MTDTRLLKDCKKANMGLLMITFQGTTESEQNLFDVSVIRVTNMNPRPHVERGTLNHLASRLPGHTSHRGKVCIDGDACDLARALVSHVGHDLVVVGDWDGHVLPNSKVG